MNGMDAMAARGRLESLEREVGELRLALARTGGPLAGLVGKSAPMKELFGNLLDWAELAFPVLVSGETGAGKSATAAALHALSRRREIFVVSPAPGSPWSLPRVPGGTIVLEALERFPIEIQEQALQSSRDTGSRFVATLTGEPEAGFQEGKILPELRDISREVTLPALRARKDDIPALAEFFLEEVESQQRSGVGAIDPKAVDAMRAHEWPGNVRELRNVIRRSHALTAGYWIGLTAIQSVLGGSSARPEGEPAPAQGREIVPVRVGDSMADVERRVLQRTLEFAKGNKRKAAEMLELSLKTIYNKVKEYGLEREFNRRFRKVPRSGEAPIRSGNR
ncbi:MAG: helix-turn-helix domain-containing protein [Thermoanaerobaculia bacterium]